MKYAIVSALLLVAAGLGQVPEEPPIPIQLPPGVVMPRPPRRSGSSPGATANPAQSAATAASAVALLAAEPGGPFLALAAWHTAAKQAAAPDSPRMAKLRQLTFDRRPSSILKAWARRPDAKAAAAKEAKVPLDLELETFQRNVTLGNWPAVKAYLVGLPTAEGKAACHQMLQSLQRPVNAMPGQRPELHTFTIDDVLGLAAAAPAGLDKDLTAGLGAILRRSLDEHAVAPDVVARLKAEVDQGPGKAALTARQAAQVLMAAGESVAAATFLPALEKATGDKDSEGLNLLARHFLGVHAAEKKVVFLERAWTATQAVLALDASPVEDKEEAVRRAVELAPKIKEELGQAWLEQSFTAQPERGMDILATIGSLAATGLMTRPAVPAERLKVLQLEKTAVEALLKAAPQRAAQWRDALTVLAGVWMREAEFTQQRDRTGPRMRRDRYGNYFWWNDEESDQMMARQQNQPMPIHTAELLRTRPEKAWMDNLDRGPRSKLSILLARLYLKVNDEKKAFPLIEEMAPSHKEAARELVNEFLRVWATNHDPNTEREYTNPYMYMYGFEMRADSIPLTRSKQERNLQDLAGWVERMRRLPLDRLDEDLLVNAFTKCHSSAEVYRLEAIEAVFGPLPKIKPRTLAGLAQKTRENLAGLWREPAEQEKKKTNRKQKDMQVEVLRGYELAGKFVGDALKQFPDDWALTLARAALLHDEVNYRQEVLPKSSDFTRTRDDAIAVFRRAAALYADQVKKLSEDEESVAVYEQWFNASLGACDLRQVNEEKLPDPRQAPLIRQAILALPGEAAERHMTKVANALFTNMSAVKPVVKHRYLKQGFAVIGDNQHAEEAKKVFDYYKDLIHEIKLDVIVDGGDQVGHREPFGMFVNLRHTREIERESNGFGRYLQNQNANTNFSYNYGRPTTDYRDRFQAAATEALKEQFEVLSVTFQSDKVHSRAAAEYGWRITPYAYLLLKPRGPQVDKVPPLRMDLDFLDTSGYVVLPVESPAVPIDARPSAGVTRPLRKLEITQILDERQAGAGKLVLEVKATGVGLVGPLAAVLDLAPEGFEVAGVDDKGVSIAKFDEEGDAVAIVSERTWLVDLRARPGLAPKTFHFAVSRVPGAEMIYQRYRDADLASAQAVENLERDYEGRGRAWRWVMWGGGAALGAIILAAGVVVLRRRPRAAVAVGLPERLTPFTVTALLRQVRQRAGLNAADRTELEQALAGLERRFFAEADGNGEVDLKTLAETWAGRLK